MKNLINNNRGEGGAEFLGLLGLVIAAMISWDRNHSILWAIVHACLNWYYVLYIWIFT